MSFEPQKFFIGLIDFFSILLPGALLTYLVMDTAGPLFVPGYDRITGTQGWIGFLFVAYLLGHFIFLLGSLLDLIYDWLREPTPARQVRRLANGEMLHGRFRRWLARRLFGPYDDSALRLVLRVQNDTLRPLGAASAINAFQWAKARLVLEQPEALATVQRFEADSKFFRSLVIVLVLLIPWGGLRLGWETAALAIVLLPLAFWRYLDQRAKSIRQAYWYIITMEGSRGAAPAGTAATDDVPLAGGVVFREQKDAPEYLIVQAKGQPDVWVLPKGHCERGEPRKQAAVREVLEETGAWARVRADLDNIHYVADGDTVTVHFFLMEFLGQAKPEDERRMHVWLPVNEAVRELTHQESKKLVQRAEAARSALL